MLVLIQQLVTLYNTTKFDTALRESLYAKCSAVVKQVLCLSQMHYGLVVKESELRNFVFGLVYLMRIGVRTDKVLLLPCIAELNRVVR